MLPFKLLQQSLPRRACLVSGVTVRSVGGRALWRPLSGSAVPPASPPAAVVTPTAPGVVGSDGKQESVWAIVKSVLAAGKTARKDKKGAAEADGSAPGTLDGASLRRLARLVRPEVATLGGAVATLGITTAISLLFPYAIGQVLDVAVVAGQASAGGVGGGVGAAAEGALSAVAAQGSAATPGWNLGSLTSALIVLFGVQSGLIVVRSALLTIAGERISATVRKDLFTAILSQETAWFDKQRTGDLINRLSSDTAVLQKALTSNVANGLRSIFMTVGGVGMLVSLSPPLAALSLVLIPPVAVAGVTYGRYVAGQQKRVQEALGRTMQVAEEAVGSHRTVRQFAGETREAQRFTTAVDESYSLARRIGIVAAYFDGGVHMAANIGLVAVLWYGGGLISSGSMSAGDLTAFLMYSLYTGFNIGNLSSAYTELKRAAGAASRVFEVVDRAPLMPLSTDAAGQVALEARAVAGAVVGGTGVHATARPIPATIRGEVTFDSVSFSYPSRPHIPVLSGFTLTLRPGTTTALVGASGSGKSTVGALLTRLYDPGFAAGEDGKPGAPLPAGGYPGRVLLDGVDIRELDPAWLRRSVGVVSQEPVLFATTIGDNIRYGKPHATDEEVMSAARAANAHDFISSFSLGYATPVGERGVQLSGGQKQRVAIARALLKDPPLLILDEATSALDAESEALVTAALLRAMSGRTVLTIAHRLSTMRAADGVAVLVGGAVGEQGTFDALAANPASAFRQLVDKQLLQ